MRKTRKSEILLARTIVAFRCMFVLMILALARSVETTGATLGDYMNIYDIIVPVIIAAVGMFSCIKIPASVAKQERAGAGCVYIVFALTMLMIWYANTLKV